MHVIYKEEIEQYYKAISSYVFSRYYTKRFRIESYELAKNRLSVYDLKKHKNVHVYVGSFPGNYALDSTMNDYLVYYPSSIYNRKATKEKHGNKARLISKACTYAISESFAKFLTDSTTFIDKLEKTDKDIYFRELLIKDKKSYLPNKLYKYLSKDALEKPKETTKRKIMDGMITLVSPVTFNDPYDVDCEISRKSMRNLFRVFCASPKYDDILMWSYYGNDHKGYCVEYDSFDILSAIENCSIKGILIIGKVKYDTKRPSIKLKSSKITKSFIQDYVKVSMTKYKKWEHEEEFRFVLVSNSFPTDNDYYPQLDLGTPKRVFSGCVNTVSLVKDSNNNSYKTVKILKHPKDYQLTI